MDPHLHIHQIQSLPEDPEIDRHDFRLPVLSNAVLIPSKYHWDHGADFDSAQEIDHTHI